MEIVDYTIEKLAVPCEPAISDSQFSFDRAGVLHLQLETDTGEVGIGLGGTSPQGSLKALREEFEPVGERLVGESPFALRERLTRPRGGHYGGGAFDGAVDTALWDLCGKHLDLPIYRLLGGDNPAVPAYASGLAFDHSDEETREVYREFRGLGFDAAKVKVGYPTVDEDLDRLQLVEDVLGPDATLMIDANEAWSPKEAIRRVHAYRDAGFDLAWVEDPVLRDDLDGIRKVVDQVPFTHVNVGEYVNLEGKRQLLERGAVDMLNVRHGMFTEAINAATLAHAHAIPTHVGDVPCELGVHLAAALPEVPYIEYWKRPWDRLTETGVEVRDGELIAPDRPGHGVTLSAEARDRYGVE